MVGVELDQYKTSPIAEHSHRSDNDMFHHLNNPVYGVLIDSIINSYLIQRCGYSEHWSRLFI